MPIYEYSCSSCGESFEELVLRPSDAEEVACPKCGSQETEKLVSGAAILGGAVGTGGAPTRSCGPIG